MDRAVVRAVICVLIAAAIAILLVVLFYEAPETRGERLNVLRPMRP